MTKLTLILVCLIPYGDLKADGYPFDRRTREVIGTNLRLTLTEAQQTEVASLGHITFNAEQTGWLRLIYQKIPLRLRVIASTYNDNLEDRRPNSVDCIWTTPTEVSITLPKKWGDEDYHFDPGFQDIGRAVDGNSDIADIRIAPSGTLYHRGVEITLEKALEIIKTAKQPEGATAIDVPHILITQPPPFRSQDEEDVAKNKKATDALATLIAYGESLNVMVQLIW